MTEGPGYNVFAVIDGAVATPDRGALEGITRLSAFGAVPTRWASRYAVAADAAPRSLRDADEIFFATTAGGIMPA